MDKHVKEFYSQYSDESGKGNFHKVIALHDSPDVGWDVMKNLVPKMPKGWFELSHISAKDRVQFSLEYWLSKIPYKPNLDQAFSNFFNQLDDIGVIVSQKTFDAPFEVHLVYSMKKDRGFYRGCPPATEDDILDLQKLFPNLILPKDYKTFLQIHNGFCKTTDCTGILSTKQMKESLNKFRALVESQGNLTAKTGKIVDPKSLVPFYESFGMPFYQCFWSDWYPEHEMGNVYYSGVDNTITIPMNAKEGSPENMAFATFTDWMAFYLEQIET